MQIKIQHSRNVFCISSKSDLFHYHLSTRLAFHLLKHTPPLPITYLCPNSTKRTSIFLKQPMHSNTSRTFVNPHQSLPCSFDRREIHNFPSIGKLHREKQMQWQQILSSSKQKALNSIVLNTFPIRNVRFLLFNRAVESAPHSRGNGIQDVFCPHACSTTTWDRIVLQLRHKPTGQCVSISHRVV